MSDFVSLDTNYTSIDTAIDSACKALGVIQKLTGGSGRGWSRYSELQRCPKAYELSYIRTSERGSNSNFSLQVGSLVHASLAFSRLGIPHFWFEMKNQNIDPTVYDESYRLVNAYWQEYAEDYLTTLAVEQHAELYPGGYSCRYDLIARIEDPNGLIESGTWIVDYKTASRFDDSTLTGWEIDGEILGEIAIYNEIGLDKIYGPLRGAMIDIIGKQKIPKFQRIFVSPGEKLQKRHLDTLRTWDKLELAYSMAGYPQSLAGCKTRFGKCQYFDFCASGNE